MESSHAVRGAPHLSVEQPAVPAAIDPTSLAIGCSLAVLSFGATLFALAIFKLLSFFVMPSLFFDLLFIGFPVGAWLGARSGQADARRFAGCLVVLQVLMLASVASGLLAKRFDYLRAHLFDVDLTQLVVQLGAFIGLFLPYFVAYGMAEYVGYQTVRRPLGGRTSRAYALTLFGGAAAYVALRMGLPWIGMARMLLLAFAAVVLAGILATRGGARRLAIGELIVVVGLSVFNVDGPFLALYKGQGMQSTYEYEHERGCRRVFQRWGRYALTEILASPSSHAYYGFYNNMFQ